MKRGLLLLTTAALTLFLTGCGKTGPSKSEQGEAPGQTDQPLKLEALSVELSKEGLSAQEMLAAVRELQSPLQQALQAHGVAVDRVRITVGSSPAATVQALENGGVDAAFLPTQVLAEEESAVRTVLVSGPACPDWGDDVDSWNKEAASPTVSTGSRALLCAAPTEYGKNLAARPTPSWEELSRASWGVLGADSLLGHQAIDLYLADHYEGSTLSDLPAVREYPDFEALLAAAAKGEIDLLAMHPLVRTAWAEAWTLSPGETDAAGNPGLGRSAPIWEEMPVLGLTERFYHRAAAVRPDKEALADPRFSAALAAATQTLRRRGDVGALATKVLGDAPYEAAPAGALDGLRRLLTLG